MASYHNPVSLFTGSKQHGKSDFSRVLIVDDEEAGRLMIAYVISENHPDIKYEFACSFAEVQALLKSNRYDIYFIDINIPVKNGLEITEEVISVHPEACIVLVSAMEKFNWAREAIRLQVYDYIVKPVLYEDIRHIMERRQDKYLSDVAQTPAQSAKNNCDFILLKILEGSSYMNLQEMVYFESDGNYSLLRLFNEKSAIRVFEGLNDIASKIGKYGFIRTGKRYIINPKYIKQLNSKNLTCQLYTLTGTESIKLSLPAFNLLIESVRIF
jgi:DNA-binding LytR/AlgR family response regulator